MATTERAGLTQSLAFIVGASSVGTLIEWYDFYIYGVLAVFFAKHFFPPGSETFALLASLAVFWFGFLLRPRNVAAPQKTDAMRNAVAISRKSGA